ncbi:LLM class flavin-dependent oxidoreductase [Nocardia harenae]|uniref:LLM class flavin-dependent oxidoreductase n=1 Tax=Nocardia harenae TaxID=358707 RepID=UPI0008369B8B|nr:LLM class flavin-dependent oxidoreductase [Nocardia harenae]
MSIPFLLGVEAAGTGAHPASWRRPDSRAEELFTGGYWADAATALEAAGADLLFVPDSFALQPGGPGVTRGRLDAIAVAARVAARTRRIGLVPQGAVTHTEPFHLAKAIQALDFASLGRAGWEVTVSPGAEQAAAFGRKPEQDHPALWHEADEAIEVAVRLWDSWEDDAEIRDVPTGRFIDREKLHYIDFAGDNFSVKGPSITPRSPQGQPIVAVRAGAADAPATAVAVQRADLIRVAAAAPEALAAHRDRLRTAVAAAGRNPESVFVLADLEIHLAATVERAEAEVAELNAWYPADTGAAHIGTTDTLRATLVALAGAVDGIVLRPLALAAALPALGGLGHTPPESGATLRDRLGLARPASRYALGGAR